jgi:hypothetical protein
MTDLAQIQTSFAKALLDMAEPVPAAVRGGARRQPERRFAVYRNNVAVGLTAALATRFPVVKRLVGEDFFAAMAREYVAASPPRSPIMLYYGDTFPDFIDGFAPASPVPYLAAVARIELARGLAYHAADAIPLGREAFAVVPAGSLASLGVVLHPSVSVVTSDYPVFSIWQVNQPGSAIVPISPWAGESVLIVRPFHAVEVHKIVPAQAAFVRALAARSSLAEAAQAGLAASAGFDMAGALALLIRAGLIVGLGEGTPRLAGN